jgi:PAS domain-containing protein
VEIAGKFITYKGQKVRIATVRNITRLEKMQEALQESELKFRTLFESANDAIFLMEFDRFIGCNKKAVQMFGCTTEDQIVGKTPYFFSPPKQPDGQDLKRGL